MYKQYLEVFSGLGTMQGEYHIQLKDNAQPYPLSTTRRVALPLLPKVKAELQRMERMRVISKIEEPTDWCAGMVVIPKPNGKIRICVDLTKLNESVQRSRHILPSVEETLAKLQNARIFTKLDSNSGFWKIPLSKDTAKLTTFITPFGRFHFNQLPFGITSAPEYFQSKMSQLLEGLEGTASMMDDILVYGTNQEEHDKRLHGVLQRLRDNGITFNKDKCVFSVSSVKFLGQIVSDRGIQPDPDKIKSILQMAQPVGYWIARGTRACVVSL